MGLLQTKKFLQELPLQELQNLGRLKSFFYLSPLNPLPPPRTALPDTITPLLSMSMSPFSFLLDHPILQTNPLPQSCQPALYESVNFAC